MWKSLDFIPTEGRIHWQFSSDSVLGSLAPALNSQGLNGDLRGSCLYTSSPGQGSVWQRSVGMSDLGE